MLYSIRNITYGRANSYTVTILDVTIMLFGR